MQVRKFSKNVEFEESIIYKQWDANNYDTFSA